MSETNNPSLINASNIIILECCFQWLYIIAYMYALFSRIFERNVSLLEQMDLSNILKKFQGFLFLLCRSYIKEEQIHKRTKNCEHFIRIILDLIKSGIIRTVLNNMNNISCNFYDDGRENCQKSLSKISCQVAILERVLNNSGQ